MDKPMTNFPTEHFIQGYEVTGIKRISDNKVFQVGMKVNSWDFIRKITMYKKEDIIKFVLHIGSGAATNSEPYDLDTYQKR